MKKGQTILFIQIGGFAHINRILHKTLETKFPEYNLEIIDLLEKKTLKYDPINYFHIFKLYGSGYPNVRRQLSHNLCYTPYFFNKVKKYIAERIKHKNVAFTFQTQTLFDASVPGIPHFIYTDHTIKANLRYPYYNHELIPSPFWLACEKEIYHNATLTFTMSRHVRQSVIEDYDCPADKVEIIYAGPLHANDKPIDEKKYQQKNILFVGKDWDRKGGPIIEKAFALVQQSIPDASLTVVGSTPELPQKNTRVFNQVPLAQLDEFYEQATLFCMPSFNQPFGLVYLAAMSHGLPVVAANSGALPDFIKQGENGYLVDSNDPAELAGYLIEILGNPEKAQAMGMMGKKIQESRYTWENTSDLLKSHIDQHLFPVNLKSQAS